MDKDDSIPVSLSFHPIVATQLHGESSLEELVDSLPTFAVGTPEDPGRGYNQVSVDNSDSLNRTLTRPSGLRRSNMRLGDRETVATSSEISEYLDMRDANWINIQFSSEDFQTQVAVVDGERKEVNIPNKSDAFAHWRKNGMSFLQGPTREKELLKRDLMNRLESSVTFEEVSIESDFLLWLYYMHDRNNKLNSEIKVKNILSVRMAGDGKEMETVTNKTSIGVDKVDIIKKIFFGKEIVSLAGQFKFGNIEFLADLGMGNHIEMATRTNREVDVENLLFFQSELSHQLLEEYIHWKDMNYEEKYPEPSFFLDQMGEISDDSDVMESMDEVMENYALKRRHGPEPLEEVETESASDEHMANPRREKIYDEMTLGDALEKVESEVLEAKKELPDNVDDIAKEVAALANTKGGALIIGLSDEGELVGVSNIREVQERVAGVITQSIEPPVDVNIIRRSIADSNLLVVTVNKIVDTPRSVNGKYYKRVGTIVQEMAPEELTRTIQSTN